MSNGGSQLAESEVISPTTPITHLSSSTDGDPDGMVGLINECSAHYEPTVGYNQFVGGVNLIERLRCYGQT